MMQLCYKIVKKGAKSSSSSIQKLKKMLNLFKSLQNTLAPKVPIQSSFAVSSSSIKSSLR